MNRIHHARHRGPKPDRRRALELLAASPDGYTEALMLAHGFPVPLLVDLCIAGLAIATPERMADTRRGRSHEDHRGGAAPGYAMVEKTSAFRQRRPLIPLVGASGSVAGRQFILLRLTARPLSRQAARREARRAARG